MFARYIATFALVLYGFAQVMHAAEFGYSIDINFGSEVGRVTGPAGINDRATWNNLQGEGSDFISVDLDIFGDRGQSPVEIGWRSNGVFQSNNNRPPNPNDASLMAGFLASPEILEIRNLDKVVPGFDGLVTYMLTIYSYGGREGADGRFLVNNIAREHIDTGEFIGDYTTGLRGNTLVFEGLTASDLTIRTDGWGPMNAISLSYCKSGDFNEDGVVDVEDLNKLSEAVKANDSNADFDVNFDLVVDNRDVRMWIECSKGTCVGDINLDGSFNSSDLVQLFQTAQYETDEPATWVTGDWNGDCKFDSSDLLLAFQEGCYEPDSNSVFQTAAFRPVPEPSNVASLFAAFSLAPLWLRRRSD